MGVLQISLFGSLHVYHSGLDKTVKLTRSLKMLLAYLLLEPARMHSRELLAGLFWGDLEQERARACLNTALWRLRRALDLDGAPAETYLLANELEVGFNPSSPHWLDVSVFQEQVGRILKRPVERLELADLQDFRQALELYQGDLLEGLYEEWVLRAREQMRLMYLNGLAYLMQVYHRGRAYEKGLQVGQQILALDPLREEIHREMMRLYQASGQRALAVRQYELCRLTLLAELGIPPMEETQALYAQIVSLDDLLPTGGEVERATNLQQALNVLYQAKRTTDQVCEQIQQAIQSIEHSLDRRE
jgi:DNA-binding SARP family transcriptional activator